MGEATIAERPAKLLGLELLRFACAIGVLIFHFRHFATIGNGGAVVVDHLPLHSLLGPVYRFGSFGVEIFWGISGFIFYWKYADAIAARALPPARFFWLRFSRLYPLHFVTLLCVAALQPIYASLAGHAFVYGANDARHFALQLFMADQWAGTNAFSFNGPIWSVSAEVAVYCAFFVLLRGWGKSAWPIIGAMLAGLLCIWTEEMSPPVMCAAFFFAGGGAAQLWRDDVRRRQWRQLAGFMLVAGTLTAPFLDLGRQNEGPLLAWLLVMIPPLLLLSAEDWHSLDRLQHLIQAAGNLTYSTYLIHFPIQLGFATIALATGIAVPVGEAWFLGAYLGVTLILGRVIFVRFEAPAQALIRTASSRRAVGRLAT